MCTSIVEIVEADGAGKGEDGEWFKLTHSVVSYDHPHHALLEEAITIDFVNRALGPGARVAVEAAVRLGWDRYVGVDGGFVGMDGFGACGPEDELFQHFGITPERIVEEVRARL